MGVVTEGDTDNEGRGGEEEGEEAAGERGTEEEVAEALRGGVTGRAAESSEGKERGSKPQ
jgi:hypothetical protein